MKLVVGVIKPFRLDEVKEAVDKAGVTGITVTTLTTAPAVAAATGATSSSFTANWTAPSGVVASYRLDVSTSSSFTSFVAGYEDLTVSGTTKSVTGLAAGTWALDVRPPWGSELNIRAKHVDGVAGGAKDVRVTVEPGGAISGTVSDGQGKGIGMAWIYANPMPKEGVQQTGNEWRYAQSRADGTFTLVGLGSVMITAITAAKIGRSIKKRDRRMAVSCWNLGGGRR